jgi:hypothetical protein
MPQILIRCPAFGNAVPTGLTTERVKFDSLSGIQFSMVCPACGKIHRWKQPKAWVERDEGRNPAGPAGRGVDFRSRRSTDG